jgi:hypothetical protein
MKVTTKARLKIRSQPVPKGLTRIGKALDSNNRLDIVIV